MQLAPGDLASVDDLRRCYAAGHNPVDVLSAVRERILACGDPAIFIAVSTAEQLRQAASRLNPAARETQPLWGVPFAVKDNIDVAGLPTTAACPAYAYQPGRDAEAVRRLVAAGAIPVGKTNLDQFATGLVGVRSPYGVPRNPRAPGHVPGGSSSGSAVAVARGLVPLALGTDTAGSGRVPAGLCGVVGLKPTPGLVSARGVVPACRSLDCVSVFANSAADAWAAFAAMAGYDPQDPYARRFPPSLEPAAADPITILGIPADADRPRFDPAAEAAWDATVERLAPIGMQVQPIPMAPFREAAAMLYDGTYVAERLADLGDFLAGNPDDAVLPVIRSIIADGGSRHSAADTFRMLHRLAELQRETEPVWQRIGALAVPTAPLFPTLAELAADPIVPNARLGTFTNFVNPLGLAAIAVPGPDRPDGLPAGITFIGPGGSEARLAALAIRWAAAMARP